MPDEGRVYSGMSLSGARWLVAHPRKLQDFISVGSVWSGEANTGWKQREQKVAVPHGASKH